MIHGKCRNVLTIVALLVLACTQLTTPPLFSAHHLAKTSPSFTSHLLPGDPSQPPFVPPVPLSSASSLESELADFRSQLIPLIQQKKTSSRVFKSLVKEYQTLLLDSASLSTASPIEVAALSVLTKKVLSSFDLSSLDRFGHTLLHSAIHHNHHLIFHYLIPLYAQENLLNLPSKTGETALLFAIKNNNNACAAFLFQAGAAHHLLPQQTGNQGSLFLAESVHYEQIEGVPNEIAAQDHKHTHDALEGASTLMPLPHFLLTDNALKSNTAINHEKQPIPNDTKHTEEKATHVPDDSKHTADALEGAHVSRAHADGAAADKEGHNALDSAPKSSNNPHQCLIPFFVKVNLLNVYAKNITTARAWGAKKCDKATVQALIDAGADITRTDDEGHNALHSAAKSGNGTLVQCLIPFCVNNNLLNAQTKNGYTALTYAVIKCDATTVKALLDAGADITPVDKDGFNVIHRAAICGKNATVQLLIPLFAKAGLLTNNSDPLLNVAAQRCDASTVKALIDAGADITQTDNFSLSNALHIAAAFSKNATVKLLTPFFTTAGLLNAQTKNGSTALIVAARFSDETTLKILIDAGADITQTDNDGFNALHRAAEMGKNVTAQFLIPLFASAGLLKAQTNDGLTALDLACNRCNPITMQALINAQENGEVTAKAAESSCLIC